MRRTDTARTAREQMLISNSVDQALAKCDFSTFNSARVFVDDKYLECVDKGYLVSSVRHRLMLNGATIATKPEEADIVMELRSGGLGTDNSDSYLGIPEIVLPGMLTLPEVRLVQRTRQTALAKIGLVAYDARNHQVLGHGGVSASQSDDTNLFVLGIGPFQSGSAKTEIDRTIPYRSGQPYQEVPSMVAFQSPIPPAAAPESSGPLRLTGQQKDVKDE